MGSRSYIGYTREDGKIEFVYCHQGAEMTENGKTLLTHFNDADSAKMLVEGGSLSSISYDGTPNHVDVVGDYVDDESGIVEIAFSHFDRFIVMEQGEGKLGIESLFLWRHGDWTVKSDWHIEGCEGGKWHRLADVIPSPSDILLKVTVPSGADADEILGNIIQHVEQENDYWQDEGVIRLEEEVAAEKYAKLVSVFKQSEG